MEGVGAPLFPTNSQTDLCRACLYYSLERHTDCSIKRNSCPPSHCRVRESPRASPAQRRRHPTPPPPGTRSPQSQGTRPPVSSGDDSDFRGGRGGCFCRVCCIHTSREFPHALMTAPPSALSYYCAHKTFRGSHGSSLAKRHLHN